MTSESFPPSGIDENFLCRALADVLVPLIVRTQFISAAPQTAGYQKVLNVPGKPAIKTKIDKVQQYYIKLSSTSELLLTEYNEDGAKELDTIISTIKFTNK